MWINTQSRLFFWIFFFQYEHLFLPILWSIIPFFAVQMVFSTGGSLKPLLRGWCVKDGLLVSWFSLSTSAYDCTGDAELESSRWISTHWRWGGWVQDSGWEGHNKKGSRIRYQSQSPQGYALMTEMITAIGKETGHSCWKVAMATRCDPFSANHRAAGTMVDVVHTALQWSRLIFIKWVTDRLLWRH